MGLIKPETITKCLTAESQLNQPQYPPHEIEEIKKCFSLYVKFPKNRWKEIEREKNDDEGNRIYNNLKAEYLENTCPNQMRIHMEPQILKKLKTLIALRYLEIS